VREPPSGGFFFAPLAREKHSFAWLAFCGPCTRTAAMVLLPSYAVGLSDIRSVFSFSANVIQAGG
jgi:hypothetical protein